MKPNVNIIALACLLCAVGLMALLFGESRNDPSLRIAALVAGTGLVSALAAIASTGARNPVNVLLRRGPLPFYGRISYGLYMTHIMVFIFFGWFDLRMDRYGIPGNHDLKNHNYSDIRLTSFWTLVEGGRLMLVEPGRPKEIEGPYPIRLHGFPCGYPVKPLKQPHDLFVEVALVHDYIWVYSKPYPDAPQEKLLINRTANFVGYDVLIFGDNHKGFNYENGNVLNCGCFQRRKSDEKNLMPCVGLLWSDGSITRKKLDTREDRWIDNVADAEVLAGADSTEFIRELESLGDAALDYAAAVKRRLANGVSKECREVVLRCLEGKK